MQSWEENLGASQEQIDTRINSIGPERVIKLPSLEFSAAQGTDSSYEDEILHVEKMKNRTIILHSLLEIKIDIQK